MGARSRARYALACGAALGAGCGADHAPAPASATAPAEPPAPPLFVDIAADVGLDFEHSAGAAGDYHLPEIMGPGVALFDYDNDGDLDVYVVQGQALDAARPLDRPPEGRAPTNRLYRNDLLPGGQLGFTDVSDGSGLDDPGYGMGVAVGDIDNDGDADLFLANYGVDRLFRNDGSGHFTDITPTTGIRGSRWTTSASFIDYDLDGDLDLYAAAYVEFNHRDAVECWFSGGTGQREYCGPLSLLPQTDRLWRNDGDGRFADVSDASGIGAVTGNGLGTTVADFDGDGRPDIYVANDQQANRLWRNAGDGTFIDTALMTGAAFNYSGSPEASMGVTAGDFDGDGDEDLFMTHLGGQTNTLMVNEGDGNFVDQTDGLNLGAASLSATGWGTRFVDYDNDGWLDLFVANGTVIARQDGSEGLAAYAEGNQLYRNERGRFRDVSTAAGPDVTGRWVSRGAAFGDIDNDGDVDIVVTNTDQPIQLLENRNLNGNGWLRVRLEGRQGVRDATGARVALLRAGQPALWRRVHSDGSYLSASDSRVVFGLGNDVRIEGVAVVWPGGRREVWRGIAANTERVLVEGSGQPWTDGSSP